MEISSIEILFVGLACVALAFAHYKKAKELQNAVAEKKFKEITYLDAVLLILGFAFLVAAIAFAFEDFRQNGLTETTVFVGFKWALAAVVISESKSIHRALRPLLGS